jgi:hypothetical protein
MSVLYSKVFLFFIFLLLVSNFMVLTDTSVSYVIALVLFTSVAIYWIVGGKLSSRLFWFDLIPGLYIIAWVYGIYLGFFNGNNPVYVLSNFAGMSLYIIYFFMVFLKLDPQHLVRVLFWAAIINALYSYISTVFLVFFEGRNYLQLLRMYYSPSLSVLGPFMAMSLMVFSRGGINRNWIGSSKAKNTCLFLFLLIPYAVLSFSKGYLASIAALIGLVLFVVTVRLVRQLKITRAGILFVFFVVLSSTALTINFWDELVFTFSVSESSNATRSEQAPKIISEFTLAGKGLGAVLDSGYSRNDVAYGFELSYHSIVHKLGLVGALILSAYVVCITIPLFHIFFRKENYYSWLAIGGMMFVVPSYGNPMIFGPVIVTLHICAMYFIRQLVLKRN